MGVLLDKAEYCAQVATCYLLLDRHLNADVWLSQSLALHPRQRMRDRSTYLIWKADTAHHLGDLEKACALVGEAAPSIVAARSARNKKRLSDIRGQLVQHETPATVALDDQIRHLLAA